MAAEDGRTFDEETLDDFMALIRDSIDTGFNQARGIIGDMSLMNDPLSNLIQKTYDKVQSKLDTFFDDTLADITGTEGEASEPGENALDETETVTRFESMYQFNGELEETSSSTFNRRQ